MFYNAKDADSGTGWEVSFIGLNFGVAKVCPQVSMCLRREDMGI